MFRPNCSAIFRLIFEHVDCTVDNAFNLRDLILQKLVKIIVICYIKDYSIINYTLHLFKDQPEDGPTIGPKRAAGIII